MDLTESKLNNDRICSKHFISGKPATIRDVNNPDWVPSLNMGYTSTLGQQSSMDRYKRLENRNKLLVDIKVCFPTLISLIKSICYPIHMSFQSRATTYGCLHEKIALKDYAHAMQKSHLNFGSDMVGLCLNPKFPQFGASPDALVSCDCCGLGCCEIKCPFCAKDLDVEDLAVLKRVGLTRNKQLDVTHQYYYQIQMQLGLTRLKYCDFVVWNKNGFVKERIFLNENFWEENYKVATKFFEYVILPELLGKYYSRNA